MMKAKTCPNCGLRFWLFFNSYSAGATSWECPHCGANMDEVPPEDKTLGRQGEMTDER
jgi:tRNA(Ile2) C34 agmatinyltransferase TiaS